MIFGKKDTEARDRVIQYKKVFGTPEGKAVLMDLMNKYHVINSHKGDPLSEGGREVVLWIMQQIHMDLEKFDQLLRGEN